MNILFGLIGIGFAYILIRYRRRIFDFTGPWGWAERYIGVGGTPTAIVLLSIVVFLVSVTVMTGHASRLLGNTLGRIF